jgi:hypothetical protein
MSEILSARRRSRGRRVFFSGKAPGCIGKADHSSANIRLASSRKPELRGDTAELSHTLSHLRLVPKLLVSNLGERLKRSMHVRQPGDSNGTDIGEVLPHLSETCPPSAASHPL